MLDGNIQFNSEKLRQGYKPIFAIKFDNYAGTAHKYYASKTVTLDGNSYLMMCESLPKITRSIEYLGGLSTIGSVNLTIINQEKESDFLRTTGLGYIMGSALIAIVFNDGTTPLWTERLEIFTGKIDDLNEISEDSLGFSLIDSSKLINQTIGTKITLDDYSKIPAENIGKVIPIIYGNHEFINIKSTSPTYFNFQYLHNMIPGIGVTNYKFLIANDTANEIGTGDIWVFDNTTNRFLNVDSSHVTINNPDADGYLLLPFGFSYPQPLYLN